MAIRPGGSRLVHRRASPLAGRNKYVSMTGLHPGDQLDHYRIEDLVARSGMASIFRATDMRSGRQVAPPPGTGSPPPVPGGLPRRPVVKNPLVRSHPPAFP